MKHLSEEQLILHYYREADAGEHLRGCAVCRDQFEQLSSALDACNAYQAPEPPLAYESALWHRIAPQIRIKKIPFWKRPLILGPLLASLLAGSFFAGRLSDRPKPVVLISDRGRQQILATALADHLDRSQRVLLEIANMRPEDGADMRLPGERAARLVSENRLYRQTAALAGASQFSDVLDDLERMLTDVANGPSELSPAELEQLQRRIESRGLIFKIRVVGTNLENKGMKQL